MTSKKLAGFFWLPLLLTSCMPNIFAAVDHNLEQPAVHQENESRLGIPDTGAGTLGTPSEPIPYQHETLPGFLEYEPDDYHVYNQTIHGRQVTVAWDKNQVAAEEARQDINQAYFDIFSAWWDVFASFPYESYTVLIKADSDLINPGEHGIGYEAFAGDVLSWNVMSSTNDMDFLNARLGHEVLHAWNNGAFRVASSAAAWFREGVANYYGHRYAGAEEFGTWMQGQLDYYSDEMRGNNLDLSLVDLGSRMAEEKGASYQQALYFKGAVVSYLIDLRLSEQGLSFDDLMRQVYQNFYEESRGITNGDILTALSEISDEEWGDFFDDYIFGTRPIDADMVFLYLEH